jgi:hypothetical protein
MSGETTVVQLNMVTNAVQGRIQGGVKSGDGRIAATDHAVWAVQNIPAPDASSPTPPGVVTRIKF